MSRYIAPGTISSERDLVAYHVSDASPVDPSSPPGYSERCIHSEVLKRYPDIKSVIHSHSEAVVPYSMSGVPLRPCFHMAGFLSTEGAPVFDIADHYRSDDSRDMLVRNTYLGSALATYFSKERDSPVAHAEHCVVLMRGHGLTVVGPSIEDTVLRAVYTQQNAGIQTTALLTHQAYFNSRAGGATEKVNNVEDKEIRYLDAAEAEGASQMTRWSAMRPWKLWVREVESQGMYVNMA